MFRYFEQGIALNPYAKIQLDEGPSLTWRAMRRVSVNIHCRDSLQAPLRSWLGRLKTLRLNKLLALILDRGEVSIPDPGEVEAFGGGFI